MKHVFETIQAKMNSFMETGEDNYFSSDINLLYSKMQKSYPQTPDMKYIFEELRSHSNKFLVSDNEADKQKYYQLSLERLSVLESKAEQAGVL